MGGFDVIGNPPPQGKPIPVAKRFERGLNGLAGRSSAPLAAGMLDSKGEQFYSAIPMSATDARFEIGSVTKAMTGTLFGIMVERGDVDPHAPVDTILGASLPWRSRPPTLAELASHQGGLPNTPTALWWREAMTALGWSIKDPWRGVDAAAYATLLAKAARTAKVGKKVSYSSMGVGLLGDALAKVAGTDFETLMNERLFGPLGMTRTGFNRPVHGADRVIVGINSKGRAVPYLHDQMPAAGMMASTTADLLRFLRAAWGEGPDPVVNGFRRALKPIARLGDVEIGYCWFLASDQQGLRAFHPGGTWASQCEVVVVPQRRTALAVLSATRRDIDSFVSEVLAEADDRV
ncbi:beta-lactamase family protein [Chitiniphilus purpureus]|uniref:Beta-lactamase family protein n=1 Tax=Chitiniphilus purpureus TaxID=2981137 RepID=A0ABY6DRD3_9NEIS|nr:serine hydrolase domain-containing protein [Chitiniphilus sp. CD1]UXY16935.1 beta-lactamase family protein [Chitiniphilus sp. CD1]